jgi:hypothetical protein
VRSCVCVGDALSDARARLYHQVNFISNHRVLIIPYNNVSKQQRNLHYISNQSKQLLLSTAPYSQIIELSTCRRRETIHKRKNQKIFRRPIT